MPAREFSSPEEWANWRADKLAKKVRVKADSSKFNLPRAHSIGADLLLKFARKIWDTLSSYNSTTIDQEVEKVVLEWAKEPYPTSEGERIRISGGFSGRRYKRGAFND